MKFTKMHGLGNDYVYVDGIHQDLGDLFPAGPASVRPAFRHWFGRLDLHLPV